MLSSTNEYLSNLQSYNHLTELNLSNLKLIKIDSFPFEQFPHLESLNLSSNELIYINSDWSKTFENSIKYFNLSHNKLETLLFLKDFHYLKTLNITKNSLRNNERFLSLYICPTIEHLIDNNQEQIYKDQLKLDQLLYLIESKNNDLINENIEDNYQIIIKLIENFEIFSEFHLSPLGNYFLEKRIISKSKENLKVFLMEDLKFSINFKESLKNIFQPIQFLHSHQQSNDNLLNISIYMCAFEPNTSKNILATCGGEKVCFIDCNTCEITHLFEVSTLPSINISTNRKIKNKNNQITKEYFSCLCWIVIENLKILAVGATNGFIYLLSPKWKLMFGHIQLPTSSISCLTWHSNNPFTLVIGSNHTVRFINIHSYIDRLQTFIRKQNQISTVQFDYVDSSMFINKVSTTHIYNLYDGIGPLIIITDLLFYLLSKTNHPLLLIGTNSGLFIIKHEEQSPIQISFPKSIWTISEYIESFSLINQTSHLIAMNILHLDQIYCFDLEQSLKYQQLHIMFTISNPSRQIPTKLAIFSNINNNDTFECIIGSNHGSFYYHQIQSSEQTQIEISWPQIETLKSPNILSASLNQHFLCLTTDNNLICIYKRQ